MKCILLMLIAFCYANALTRVPDGWWDRRPCTKIGCVKPPPGCKRTGITYPNGRHCPGCQVCLDKPVCAKRCPPPPKQPCRNMITTYPNGRDCPPCKVCFLICPQYLCVRPPPNCLKWRTPRDSNGCPQCRVCIERGKGLELQSI